jgi:hypothetical protein
MPKIFDQVDPQTTATVELVDEGASWMLLASDRSFARLLSHPPNWSEHIRSIRAGQFSIGARW